MVAAYITIVNVVWLIYAKQSFQGYNFINYLSIN